MAEYARDHFGDNFENLGEIIQKTQKDSERTIAIKEWLRRRFLSFDSELIRLDKSGEKSFQGVGCTANVSFIDHEKQMLYVANAGDARCILAEKSSTAQGIT